MPTVLITGGATRIGRSMAIALAKEGYDIAVHYNSSKKEAFDLRELILSLGVKCELFKADFRKEKDIKRLIDSVFNKFLDIEILINNSSIFKKAKFLDTELSLLDSMFSINFRAPFILSQIFAKRVKKGLIVNMLDTKIEKNLINYFAYTLSKKTLAELTKMLAKELAPDIRVNAIAPGVVLPPEGEGEGYIDELINKIPLQRKAELDEVNSALLFLINNRYITGEIIFVDGGQSL